MKTKNTRLVYTDEKNLKAYASLPAEDFKEFFMTYLTYQDGDDVSKTISNPFVQTLFMAAYADKITHNEKKWEDAAEKRRENGKKGGRPKKNNDITPNEEFDNTVTIELPIEEPVKEEPIETTVEEFEKDNYSNATYDFLDENDEFIKDRVIAIVNGKLDPNNPDKQYWMTEAYRTIKERCFEHGYYRDTDTYREITDVIKSMINNRIEIAAEYGRE